MRHGRYCVFDLDDTVWCTNRTMTRALGKLDEWVGENIPKIHKTWRPTFDETMDDLRKKHPDKRKDYYFLRNEAVKKILTDAGEADRIAECFSAYYKWRNTPVYYEGALECLERLKNH